MSWVQVAAVMAKDAVLCDAHSKAAYEAGHIMRAVHTPLPSLPPLPNADREPDDPPNSETGSQILDTLRGTDKASLIIFYCGGPTCHASWKAAVIAKA